MKTTGTTTKTRMSKMWLPVLLSVTLLANVSNAMQKKKNLKQRMKLEEFEASFKNGKPVMSGSIIKTTLSNRAEKERHFCLGNLQDSDVKLHYGDINQKEQFLYRRNKVSVPEHLQFLTNSAFLPSPFNQEKYKALTTKIATLETFEDYYYTLSTLQRDADRNDELSESIPEDTTEGATEAISLGVQRFRTNARNAVQKSWIFTFPDIKQACLWLYHLQKADAVLLNPPDNESLSFHARIAQIYELTCNAETKNVESSTGAATACLIQNGDTEKLDDNTLRAVLEDISSEDLNTVLRKLNDETPQGRRCELYLKFHSLQVAKSDIEHSVCSRGEWHEQSEEQQAIQDLLTAKDSPACNFWIGRKDDELVFKRKTRRRLASSNAHPPFKRLAEMLNDM